MTIFPLLFFIALSIPDASIDAGVINLRLDDIIVYLFLVTNLSQCIQCTVNVIFRNKQYVVFGVLFFYMILSLLFIAMFFPEKIHTYYLMKTIGSFPYLLVLPCWLSQDKYRRFLFYGVIVGSFLFFIQVYLNLSSIHLYEMRNSASIKSAATFGNLNPNAIGTYAVIFVMYAVILRNSIENIPNKVLIVYYLSLISAFTIPYITFTRGNIGVLTVFLFLSFVFVFNAKQRLLTVSFALIGFFVFLSLFYDQLSNYILGAFDIDFSSGEGTSSRIYLWNQALELVDKNPIFGQGMTTEKYVYKLYFQGEMSHNIFFRYWIELGALGLVLFVASYAQLSMEKFFSILKSNHNLLKFQLILMISFFASDIFGQVQYFDKLHYLILFVTTINFLSIKE